ncbi:hypothetical protein TVAG_322980 [Trichomonas vaginalis G3]|uniref:Uncharacterized protein n=1 Tax=Trichomonas vaginalis (strain ATCC PRA-98 / G3) TaxID=412133 RepID=A2G1A4_TRIV3|nr:armadillo (ARM) repeat-containing protein family [Trichomonas vaginalis G3]EAX89062.1 hypothetical protein TVAG_322980 [Trichomonas vaginalis G3]KAI5536917.1 armadillo (ARM) repeat-containing protein family [Trichomonas vaginalis G3]|eukprot:XP_001301992.1 hypothetical protein [Trichomonas vaginalis G3]
MDYKDENDTIDSRNRFRIAKSDLLTEEFIDEEDAPSSDMNEFFLVKNVIDRSQTPTTQAFYDAVTNFGSYLKTKRPNNFQDACIVLKTLVENALNTDITSITPRILSIIHYLIDQVEFCLDCFIEMGYFEILERYFGFSPTKALCYALSIYEVLIYYDRHFFEPFMNLMTIQRLKSIVIDKKSDSASKSYQIREIITAQLVDIFNFAVTQKTTDDIIQVASETFKIGFSPFCPDPIKSECMRGIYSLYKTDQFNFTLFSNVEYTDLITTASVEENFEYIELFLYATIPFIPYDSIIFSNDIAELMEMCSIHFNDKIGAICLKIINKMIQNDVNDNNLQSFLDQNGIQFLCEYSSRFNFVTLKSALKVLLAIIITPLEPEMIYYLLTDEVFTILQNASSVDNEKIAENIFKSYELLYSRSIVANLLENYMDLINRYGVYEWLNEYYDDCSDELIERFEIFMNKVFGQNEE